MCVLQIKARARAADYDFNQPEWRDVSDSAKDLLRKLIVKDPSVRMPRVLLSPRFSCLSSDPPGVCFRRSAWMPVAF